MPARARRSSHGHRGSGLAALPVRGAAKQGQVPHASHALDDKGEAGPQEEQLRRSLEADGQRRQVFEGCQRRREAGRHLRTIDHVHLREPGLQGPRERGADQIPREEGGGPQRLRLGPVPNMRRHRGEGQGLREPDWVPRVPAAGGGEGFRDQDHRRRRLRAVGGVLRGFEGPVGAPWRGAGVAGRLDQDDDHDHRRRPPRQALLRERGAYCRGRRAEPGCHRDRSPQRRGHGESQLLVLHGERLGRRREGLRAHKGCALLRERANDRVLQGGHHAKGQIRVHGVLPRVPRGSRGRGDVRQAD
mmetsp:Transcript_61449/g.180314  ORF Transcript_61449/g.180314 Transcript_61449/m.180314 type:complete len:303 (-) Transcript_61449:987-1895(-)